MSTKVLGASLVVVAVLAIGGFFYPQSESVVERVFGAFSGPDIYDEVRFHDSVSFKEPVVNVTTQVATTTLSAEDSGTTYSIATSTTFVLPAVTNVGTHYRFVVGGALATTNVIVDSAEGDNLEGTLIVAGAVVDCDAEDQLNFVVDGENIGDYVEVRSNGSKWLIGDSGVLTAAKLTCTDPS